MSKELADLQERLGRPHLATVSVAPSLVIGGDLAEGTLQLELNPFNLVFPTNSTVDVGLHVESDPPGVAVVPEEVEAKFPGTTAFPIATHPASGAVDVKIVATLWKAAASATLRIVPPEVTGLKLWPFSHVVGGGDVDCYVDLVARAPTLAGVAVAMSTDDDAVAFLDPPFTHVTYHKTRGKSVVHTNGVDETRHVVITAASGSTTCTAGLSVAPAALSAVRLNGYSQFGVTFYEGEQHASKVFPLTVHLDGKAATDALVEISVADGHWPKQADVALKPEGGLTVDAGSSVATGVFEVRPCAEGGPPYCDAMVQASYRGKTLSAQLTVQNAFKT